MAVVETSMHFLARDDLYKTEKPYQLKYAANPGIPKSNLRLENKNPIKISNIRGQEGNFSLEKTGFAVLRMDKEIPYDDFNSPEGIRRYLDAVTESVRNLLDAGKVQAFQYVIRKRDPGFPIAKEGKGYEHSQPTTIAHVDSTPEQAASTFQQVNGDPPNLTPELRYQVVNVWKPLRGPLRDWPLALCDAASIQADDLVATDQVLEEKVTENMQVHYDAAHRWYYLEDQEPSELLVFRQTNSHPNGQLGMSGDSECNILIDKTAYLGKGVPHSSFPNPLAGGDELPRESIEVRTIVSYSNVA